MIERMAFSLGLLFILRIGTWQVDDEVASSALEDFKAHGAAVLLGDSPGGWKTEAASAG